MKMPTIARMRWAINPSVSLGHFVKLTHYVSFAQYRLVFSSWRDPCRSCMPSIRPQRKWVNASCQKFSTTIHVTVISTMDLPTAPKVPRTPLEKETATRVVVVLEKACLETVKAGKGYELLNCDDHAHILKKHKRDPAECRPDITHQVLNVIVLWCGPRLPC